MVAILEKQKQLKKRNNVQHKFSEQIFQHPTRHKVNYDYINV